MKHPTVLIPKVWSPSMMMKAANEGGRRHGKPFGAYVDDLAALKRTFLLCSDCHFRFDWRRHGYYSVRRYEHTLARGKCFACRGYCEDGRLFLHEDQRTKCWTTKDQRKEGTRHATTVGMV